MAVFLSLNRNKLVKEAKLDGLRSTDQAFTSGKSASHPAVSTSDSSATIMWVSEET